MADTSFPDSAVVYILDDIPGEGEFQGTGVIIGPHTILTASHLLYNADKGVTADAISLYPGFTPGGTAYNPSGALGGSQTIHGIKVNDRGDALSAQATQSDFAIIDTTADLSAYGSFALDPTFTSGDVVVKGYPSSNGGSLTGAEGEVVQDGTLSDLDTTALPLSPGYSGGPLYDTVRQNGQAVDAVVGTVSTGDDATKLTRGKIALIRSWIASDQAFDDAGGEAPKGLVPQISGTLSSRVDAAPAASGCSPLDAAVAPAFAYRDHAALAAPSGRAGHHGGTGHGGTGHGGTGHRGTLEAVSPAFADLVEALHRTEGGTADPLVPAASAESPSLAPPHHRHHGGGRIAGEA